MKSIKYLLVSLLALCSINSALACWESWYTPSGYYMYRAYEYVKPSGYVERDYYPGEIDNCREWQRLTSPEIPIKDISKVVYHISLEEMEQMYDNPQNHYENKFAEWITKRDKAILDFLLLAKTNSYVRNQMNSRWYYPTMKIGARMTIEEIAEKALSVKDKRLRDRYLLQAVRALFTSGKYEQCIELWNNEIKLLPEKNLMRQLCHSYIAGAYYRTDRSEEAIDYFAQIGDVESMLYCVGKSGYSKTSLSTIEFVCQYNPDAIAVRSALQHHIRDLEPFGEYAMRNEESDCDCKLCDDIYTLCMNVVNGSKSKDKAFWYYTLAFLADLKGEIYKANYWLDLAEKRKTSQFITESIAVMRIYLDAKLSVYNSAYEAKLLNQLQWLDGKIVNDITDYVREMTAKGYRLQNCESYYYWNDMMRRILLSEVCPRMIQAGKSVRALQLANMADNRLLGIVNKQMDWDGKTHTMREYRYSAEHFNAIDYRNHFFEMVDSLGVNTAKAYLRRVESPRGGFDSFLNARGYTDRNYLYDIVGTQCLRTMQYGEAVKYLKPISIAFQYHHNLYMDYDPFCVEHEPIEQKINFKYDFAKEMNSLQQSINVTEDPNRKAEFMVKYAMGIRNSFSYCWALTQYYKGTSYYGQVCDKRDWQNDSHTKAAMKRSKEMIKLALETISDDELGANILYDMCNYKTVANKYPNTIKGELVRGSCDNLVNYHAENPPSENQRGIAYQSWQL